MNDELSYAEMLEIPVETVTVSRREKKRKKSEDLSEKLMERVNDRVRGEDPAYTESREIEREAPVKKKGRAHTVLAVEFAVVVLLCAAIFLTNLFLENSAINTFVRGLFRGNAQTADARIYSDFALSSVIRGADAETAEIAVSEAGVMSFTAHCSVYPLCAGKLESLRSDEGGYTIRIRHSDSFSTVMSGLDSVYYAPGDTVYENLPVAYSEGERPVRVLLYDGETAITSFTVTEGKVAWV